MAEENPTHPTAEPTAAYCSCVIENGAPDIDLSVDTGLAQFLLDRSNTFVAVVEGVASGSLSVVAGANQICSLTKDGGLFPELGADLFGEYARVAPLLANVAVVPGARRKGLGRRLVAACADLARDGWGYDDVLLEVECDNRPAVALYERVGFQELWRAPRAALEVDPRRESGPPLKRRDNVDHVAMRLPV